MSLCVARLVSEVALETSPAVSEQTLSRGSGRAWEVAAAAFETAMATVAAIAWCVAWVLRLNGAQ